MRLKKNNKGVLQASRSASIQAADLLGPLVSISDMAIQPEYQNQVPKQAGSASISVILGSGIVANQGFVRDMESMYAQIKKQPLVLTLNFIVKVLKW